MLALSDPITNEAPAPLAALRVLLIEADRAVADTIWRCLEGADMRMAWAPNASLGMHLKQRFLPEVVLLEPAGFDGEAASLIGRLAGAGDCCVIVLSNRGEEADRVAGLEAGADDYIVKPPPLRELVARIRAVHRRLRGHVPDVLPRVGGYRVDRRRRAVFDATGRPVALTGAEFDALQTLLEAAGEPVSRERLSEAALRHPWRPEDRSIDQLIFNLRRKLSDGDRALRLIQSVRGAGYVLAQNGGLGA
jgi:DNA-binding response OmpR family regulator